MKVETKNIKWFVLLILVIAGFFIYANSFSNKLFWDDDDTITNNIYTKDLSNFPKYFSENLIAGSGQVSNYWRPLVLTSFALTNNLFGANPGGYHLVNLLWHILAAWLAFLFLYKLTDKFWLSFLPALFFLIHPLQTEAVTYVSGLADPMSSALVLLALLTFVIFRKENKKYYLVISYLAFLVSLLAKEQAILLPALIFLVEGLFFFDKKNWKKSLMIFTPFALISVAFFLARITFLNFNDVLSGTDYTAIYDSSLKVRLLTFTYVFVKYLSLLFAPFNLHMAYEVTPITTIFSWSVAEFLIAILGIALVLKTYWYKNKLVVFGLAWFLILLLPRTNIISINRPLYEHWLYLPMLGFWLAFFIIMSEVADKIKNKKIIIAVILILSVVYFSVLTIKRNFIWHDPVTFYENNLRYTPNSFIQRNNLGMAYSDLGRHAGAIAQYKTAISIRDIYPQVHYNLGNELAVTGKNDEAESEYHKAINMSPQFILPYSRLVIMALEAKNQDKLMAVLSEMKKNFPEQYYLNTAFDVYYYLSDYQQATKIGQEIMEKYPDNGKIGLLLLQMSLTKNQ